MDKKKDAIKPPLSSTRMGMIRNSISRLPKILGDINIKHLSILDLENFYSADHRKLNNPDEKLGSKTLFDVCTTLNEFFTWGAKIAGCDPIYFEDLGYDHNETEPITIQQQIAIVD